MLKTQEGIWCSARLWCGGLGTRWSRKGGEVGKSLRRRNLQSPSKLMNFNRKDNLPQGVGQRYCSLPPPPSARLLFRMVQPLNWQKQSENPQNSPLIQKKTQHTTRKNENHNLEPSDDYFVWPITMKIICEFLVARFSLTLSAGFGLIKARLKCKQALILVSPGEICSLSIAPGAGGVWWAESHQQNL